MPVFPIRKSGLRACAPPLRAGLKSQPPPEPAHSVHNWMDPAGPALRNRLDWREPHPVAAPHKTHHHLGLDLKMFTLKRHLPPCLKADQPQSALCVAQGLPRDPRNLPAHATVDPPPEPAHAPKAARPVPHHQIGTCRSCRREQGRNILRPVLPIPIQKHGPRIPAPQCLHQPGPHSRPLPPVAVMPHHPRPGSPSLRRSAIPGPIIHNDHRRHLKECPGHGHPHPARLIEAGDDRNALVLPIHDLILDAGSPN